MTISVQEEKWRDDYRKGDSSRILRTTPSTVLQRAIRRSLSDLPENSHLLIHGCGTDKIIPKLAADFSNISKITGVDFKSVIEQREPAPENEAWSQKFNAVGMDALNLHKEFPTSFDAVLSISSLVAPRKADNWLLLKACFDATKPGGRFIGSVPTIEYSESLLKGNHYQGRPLTRWAAKALLRMGINSDEDTLSVLGNTQNLPRTSSLVGMFAQVGYEDLTIKRLDLNDPAALAALKEAYGRFNADTPVFVNYVEAKKPVTTLG